MNLKYSFSSFDIRNANHNLPVKRPGLSNASRMSGLLAAAITICLINPKPVHFNKQLIKCLFPLIMSPSRPAPLCLPTASISSPNIIHGELFSLDQTNPVPMFYTDKHFNKIGSADTKKTASPETAFARRVLPVPEDLPIHLRYSCPGFNKF